MVYGAPVTSAAVTSAIEQRPITDTTSSGVVEHSSDTTSAPVEHPSNAASPYAVEHLSDAELLAGTRGLVARSNLQLARLLAHLAEIEARGIHRARACASLCTYCIYELRLSEDTAFRYARAARLVRNFPLLLDAIATGELHLTGLLLLGPHLTDENLRDVLQLAKHRSKREITKLVRRLDPLPDVPARIEPLGPANNRRFLRNPTWSEFMDALCPVRHLAPGERPRDWFHLGTDPEPHTHPPSSTTCPPSSPACPTSANERPDKPPWLDPQRYSVQFTATQEYVDLVRRARDLLSHTRQGHSLAEVHLRAMRLLVATLEKRKFGITQSVTDHPSNAHDTNDIGGRTSGSPLSSNHQDSGSPLSHDCPIQSTAAPRRRGPPSATPVDQPSKRHIPLHVRRQVYERDGGRCAYISADGQRCQETSLLELHHHQPHAHGGPACVENLSLYCRTHNALAAEQDFGRDYMARRSGRDL